MIPTAVQARAEFQRFENPRLAAKIVDLEMTARLSSGKEFNRVKVSVFVFNPELLIARTTFRFRDDGDLVQCKLNVRKVSSYRIVYSGKCQAPGLGKFPMNSSADLKVAV